MYKEVWFVYNNNPIIPWIRESNRLFLIDSSQKKQVEDIKNLKITVRLLNKEDIKNRNLPNQTTGVIVTKIENDSPLKNTTLAENDIIVEAQKKRIRSISDLNQITEKVLNSNQKTILFAIYNSQNQRRYIGVKLD